MRRVRRRVLAGRSILTWDNYMHIHILGHFRTFMGGAGVLFELEGHGREDLFAGVDLTRTVGLLIFTMRVRSIGVPMTTTSHSTA